MNKKTSSIGKSNVSRHTANVALTPARAITSHVRKRYEERYRGRYRLARAVFTFDLALLVLAMGLLVLNIAFFTRVFDPAPGVDLTLRRGEIVAEALTPLEAVVRSADGALHEDVRVTWQLPPSVEVVRAEPAMTNGTVRLDRVAPGSDAVSRIFVRIRAVPQTKVPIGFLVREGTRFDAKSFTGTDTLFVASSALTAEPALPVHAVEPGGSIPIAISNRSTLTATAVIVRLLAKNNATSSGFGASDEYVLGNLAPGERHLFWLDVDPTAHGRLEYTWEVQDGSLAVSRQTLTVDVAADPVAVKIDEPLRSTPGSRSTDISYEAERPAKLLVFHALQATTTHDVGRSYDLASGNGIVHIPLRSDIRTTDTVWWAVPYEIRNGRTVFGKRMTGLLATNFQFSTAARYFGPSGDQLGIGPIPPLVGETTSYWIVWTVGPTDADLKDLVLRGELGPNVRATGRYASIIPGDFIGSGASVEWTIPSLPTTGHDPVTFAFEVLFKPTGDQRGTVPVLVRSSTANAIEVRSELNLEASDGSEDANLIDDIQARGKGRVE